MHEREFVTIANSDNNDCMVHVPFTFRATVAFSIAMTGIVLFYLHKNAQEKSAYDSITGKIMMLEQRYDKWPIRNVGKFRYLGIEGYPYVFEIFVGNEPGDFSPEFEQIDSLRVGDVVSIYYYETNDTRADRLNRFAKFIDKGSKSYYEDGDSGLTIGIVMVILMVVLVAGSWVLWKRGKMPY